MVIDSPLDAKLLSEFVGSGLLVAVGLGAAVAGGDFGTVALAHGLVIGALVTTTGHVSGGHFNPAITITLMALRLKGLVEGLLFIVAQLSGAVVGTAVLAYGTGADIGKLAGAMPTLADGQDSMQAFVLVALASFLLVWTVFGVGLDRDGAWFRVAGLPIGLAVTACILMIGPAGGAALATTRWFGPAVLTMSWDHALVWASAPIVGALVAGFAYVYGIRPRVGGVISRAGIDT